MYLKKQYAEANKNEIHYKYINILLIGKFVLFYNQTSNLHNI
jgi:hypothetical protein